MASYNEIKAVLERDLRSQEAAYPLMDESMYSQVWLHPQPTARVCLFLHGFTAGPYQFQPLGEKLYQAGYNVLAPLMPGHGRAGDWSKDNPPPLPTDSKEYLTFGVKWLNLAKQMGDKVVVGGLSGGGTLCSWLAYEKSSDIDRALLFAPYMSASLRVIDLFVNTFDDYFEWEKTVGQSYQGFALKALRAVLSIGKYVMAKSRDKGPVAPMFVISSESDKAVNNLDHRTLFDRAVSAQPQCWYNRFGRTLDIPHTMLTKAEGDEYQDLLNVMAQAFIESDLTWEEMEEVAYRMTKGRTFPDVITELNFQDRASKDLPAMITMVDKAEILAKRQRLKRGGKRRVRPRDR
ncbi:MAG: alpha/beta hydrolase [Leptolyngbyaceae cyanobacterium]